MSSRTTTVTCNSRHAQGLQSEGQSPGGVYKDEMMNVTSAQNLAN